ncbi:MAG: molybdopterin-guanine dinucleotide biosynthesis protein B [Chloroflexi bacterium]|nr:molybdopterin-guanine dinucleotide biosynthesis protein B [Chloroflexota bacterium]
MKPPIISFVGRSNTGKTTILVQLIQELARRGYRTGIAKHTHHGFDLDRPGKDSWRFSQAGASMVLLSAPQGVALLESVEPEWELERLVALAGDRVDLMLAEGFRGSEVAKVEVYRAGVSEGLLTPPELLLALVTDTPLDAPVCQFEPQEVAALADLLVTKLRLAPRGTPAATRTGLPVGLAGFEPAVDQPVPDRTARFLSAAAALHGHLCAGQVLGVRMALRGCQELEITPPDREKRLLVFVEIDRCATDAISVVTGCKLGARTLKFLDYGKLAATFLDLRTGRAVRVAAREDAREHALSYEPEETDPLQAQLQAYQVMPDEELFAVQPVRVQLPEQDLPGRPRARVRCQECQEGINDGREVVRGERVLCRSCASGVTYYSPVHLVF